jgi:hypothetical protein
VVTWNNSSLKPQSTIATVTGNLFSALSALQAWNRIAPRKLRITSSASGGFMTAEKHADGGYIVNQPTVVGRTGNTWHIAGEDGAEWIEPHAGGIIPLTNRRYTQPFADEVANGISRDLGRTGDVYNIYIDGARVNDGEAINGVVGDFLLDLDRLGVQTYANH